MTPVELVLVYVALPLLTTSSVLYLLVVYRGPTISDRVLSADVFFFTFTLFFGIVGLLVGSPVMVICTVVLVLWAYALDIYVAKYLERGELGD
jgi:multicomponent Na+:H+ antiporter subunit F